jgi:HEAT repeat protein
MGDDKADARALVSSVLSQVTAASPKGAPGGEPAPTAAAAAGGDQDAAELIDVYFELEQPAERDALFDRLVQIPSPLVTEFLRTMLGEDEDEYVRAAAAAELARRGVAEGYAALEQDLDDPEEPFFFEHAIRVLSEVRGTGFYETLAAIWRDPQRDGDQRREAMLGMEHLDLERALGDFLQLVEASTDIEAMPDDQLEVAIMAFVRHDFEPALPALVGLSERVAAAALDPSDAAELRAFIQEGIDLLRA